MLDFFLDVNLNIILQNRPLQNKHYYYLFTRCWYHRPPWSGPAEKPVAVQHIEESLAKQFNHQTSHSKPSQYGSSLDRPLVKMRTSTLLALAVAQRVAFLFWGAYQDAHMELRFTDIDYFVFTDASRFVNEGLSPYDRATYRYTPLLAWLLIPSINWFSAFGKVVFSIGDLVAGVIIIRLLRQRFHMSESKACWYAATWLINPMVSTISTRGSSEGLLGAVVMLFLYAVCNDRWLFGGLLAGFSVHFKIYPVIYIPTVLWAIDTDPLSKEFWMSLKKPARAFEQNRRRLVFLASSLLSFSLLTGAMYYIYGYPFLLHSYLHHLSRVDHRHNFSPYSTFLYMWSSPPVQEQDVGKPLAALYAFVPQLVLSAVILPVVFARKDMVKTMFLQTFAFVTFNKVCTSQYFMWYMVLLPFYIESIKKKRLGELMVWLVLWILSQVLWIRKGYELEFMGISTFYPGLFFSTILFFLVNCWGIGLFIDRF